MYSLTYNWNGMKNNIPARSIHVYRHFNKLQGEVIKSYAIKCARCICGTVKFEAHFSHKTDE